MQKIQRAVGFPELTHATKMSLQSAGKTDAPNFSVKPWKQLQ